MKSHPRRRLADAAVASLRPSPTTSSHAIKSSGDHHPNQGMHLPTSRATPRHASSFLRVHPSHLSFICIELVHGGLESHSGGLQLTTKPRELCGRVRGAEGEARHLALKGALLGEGAGDRVRAAKAAEHGV